MSESVYTKEVNFTTVPIDGWFKLHPGAKETYQKKTFNSYFEGKLMGEVQVLPWTNVFVIDDTTTADDAPVAHV